MTDRRLSSRVVAGLPGLPRAFVKAPEPGTESDQGPDAATMAFAEGRREGYEAGAAQAAEAHRVECDALRQAISATVKSLVDLRVRTTRQHEQAMFELALAAASRMLRDAIDRGDPVAARALEEALAALPGSGVVAVRLHPDDIESIERDLAQTIESGRIVLTADATIGRGGCVVESSDGTIDATVETAREMIHEAASGTGAS